MEAQEKLEKNVGTREVETLKPVKVKIVNVTLDEVKFGSKTSEKVILSCEHPDRDEPIEISKAKILKKEKVKAFGLWYKLDKDENIQKGSTLAELMVFAKVEKLIDLKEKEFETIADSEGFLCIKAY